MSENFKNKHEFDLEDRTLKFAKQVVNFCRTLKKDAVNLPLISQAVRSAGSIGANYREANDALGKKDFSFRIKITRKEAKETEYWLNLIQEGNPELKENINNLIKESRELRNIFSAILNKVL